MPLPNYGVLCGTFNRFEKESPDDFGKWFHGFIYVNTPVGVYQCAVDVNSPTGEFEYMMLGGLDPAMFTNVSALPDGYHELPRTPASGAIDYIRSPFVNQAKGCLALILAVWNSIFGTNRKVWTANAGDEALNKLKDMITASTRLYVFGAPYTYGGNGVHDIHLNQGDPPGSQWYAANGTWQDGCVIAAKPGETKLFGYFGKFVTQSLNTDNNGNPV
jgi:Uncharacterized conserved protein (DUF2278)